MYVDGEIYCHKIVLATRCASLRPILIQHRADKQYVYSEVSALLQSIRDNISFCFCKARARIYFLNFDF